MEIYNSTAAARVKGSNMTYSRGIVDEDTGTPRDG